MLALVGACCAFAWLEGPPLAVPPGGVFEPGRVWPFLIAFGGAFAAYLAGLWLVRAGAGIRAVVAIAVAVQTLPLAAPLILSSDAWTYWAYGRIAAVHGANPYVASPEQFPLDPSLGWAGSAWLDTPSVYGPAFTLASEPAALALGESANAAAWGFKAVAALAAVAIVLLAARLSARPAFAAAFVGWNPVLALHLAGGGHNDAWVGALVLGALALAASARPAASGAAWALSIGVKWVTAPLLALHALERRPGLRLAAGFAASLATLAALASWRYGSAWLGAFEPLARTVFATNRFALPHRLTQAGVPEDTAIALLAAVFVVAYAWLAWQAWRGRARLALAAGLLVACSPYIVPWYLAWVVPLAAVEEDRTARVLALTLSAYLLPQTIVRF